MWLTIISKSVSMWALKPRCCAQFMYFEGFQMVALACLVDSWMCISRGKVALFCILFHYMSLLLLCSVQHLLAALAHCSVNRSNLQLWRDFSFVEGEIGRKISSSRKCAVQCMFGGWGPCVPVCACPLFAHYSEPLQ